jgi:hypothetical protein
MPTTGCMSGLHERLDRLLQSHGSNNRMCLYGVSRASTTMMDEPLVSIGYKGPDKILAMIK